MDKDLEKRVEQFKCMELPGQPMSSHMGTWYLVDDLVKEVQRLELALSHIVAQGSAPAPIGYPQALKIVKTVFDDYAQDFPKWGKRFVGTPAANDLQVRIALAFRSHRTPSEQTLEDD